jgi:hypothetical protein
MGTWEVGDWCDENSQEMGTGVKLKTATSGHRPAMLPDHLDGTVAALVRVSAMDKMIVVQALELSPIG